MRANVVAYLALFFAMTGTSFAARAMWNGSNITDESLTGADVQNGSLTGGDIENGSIQSSDLASGTGSSGGTRVISGKATVLKNTVSYTGDLADLGPTVLTVPGWGVVKIADCGEPRENRWTAYWTFVNTSGSTLTATRQGPHGTGNVELPPDGSISDGVVWQNPDPSSAMHLSLGAADSTGAIIDIGISSALDGRSGCTFAATAVTP